MRPPVDSAEVGESWTFSLSTPGGQKKEKKRKKDPTVKARADQKGALRAPPPTWGVLGGGQRGHGVGQVQVGSDAELALAAWGVGGGGRAQLLLPPLLLGRGQVAVDQRLQELDDQLGVVGDLRLLKAQEESDPRRCHGGRGPVWAWLRGGGRRRCYLGEGPGEPPQTIEAET